MESKIFAKMSIDPGILVILSLVIAIAALVALIFLYVRQSRLEISYKLFMRGRGAKSLEETLHQQLDSIDVVKDQTETMNARISYIEKSMSKSYQKCGIVKYDAFKEQGGQLSFVCALLNDTNTGFLLNCIHSREGSYTYIKEIVKGQCNLPLSEEESQAVNEAVNASSPIPVSKIAKNAESSFKALSKKRPADSSEKETEKEEDSAEE